MRCGKCREYTDDVEHVRACYGFTDKPKCLCTGVNAFPSIDCPVHTPKRPEPTNLAPTYPPEGKHSDLNITEKQYNYIVNLLTWKGQDESEVSDKFGFTILDCYKDEASEVIDYLKKLPNVKKPSNQPREDEADVPAGRYALREQQGNLPYVWKFYQVDKPTQGKWAGRQFLSVLASDEKHPVRDAQRRAKVLSRIALDPAKASRDYGRQVGRCGVCGRTLTDADSIAEGVGPVCAGKL